MKAIEVSGHGPLDEVTSLVEREIGEPREGEVILEMVAACINPSDTLAIKGLYPRKIMFPSYFGNEGVGRVKSVGNGVSTVKLGDLVMLPAIGTWRSAMKVRSDHIFPLPKADALQLAMLTVNPPTAFLLLKKFVDLKEGDWIIQNAANSAVGQYIIQLAKSMGVKTVNLVRRESLVEELKAIGADVVLVDGKGVHKLVKEATGGANIRLAIDAVSGDASDRLITCLGHQGTMVVYGSMSLEKVKLNMSTIMTKDLTIRAFWLSTWYNTAPREEIQEVITHLTKLIANGKIQAKIGATYPLEQYKEALKHADSEGKNGKILFVGSELN